MKRKICIMGLGYIGLPTAALLATKGHQVHGVDIKPEVVDIINKGLIHIVEPELDAFVKSAVQSGNLKASLQPDYADIFIITVPTPVDGENNPDISYVVEAAKAIAPFLKEGNFLILESTSPIGTTEKLVELLQQKGVDVGKLHVVYSPERVLPGQTMRELVENDRIVGGITPESAGKVCEFYQSFVQGKVIKTNARTAEMSKLTENACRDVNIAFANELSILCDKFNIDVWELISLANRHPRINILKPGSGVGGHCIAVDPWFIVAEGKDDARIIRTAREINNRKPQWVVDKVINEAKLFRQKNNRDAQIACLGIAFKPDIDDLRESPSLHIVNDLLSKGIEVLIVEPNIKSHKSIHLTPFGEAIAKADIIVFLVAHKEFRKVQIPANKIVIDICGVQSKFN
ncbi:MAG TPA: UDP-N-acetyl-D-mannosamine dehydrogenase [Bacteroidales bacterium]|nr:UDP-N-acetyl-D-mannosamine dehydrogenase [Bacteroidales bacterium]